MIFEALPKSRLINTIIGMVESFLCPQLKKASTVQEKPKHWEFRPIFVHFPSLKLRSDLPFWVKLANFGFLHL